MKRPQLHTADSDGQWAEILRQRMSPGGTLHVVCTPSMEGWARRFCAGLSVKYFWSVKREPMVSDFSWLEQVGPADLVVGIGGGKALDAAKVVAYWGVAYDSVSGLRSVLDSGKRLDDGRRAGLVLAPSIASSGSETSVGAIIGVDGIKTGLRGSALAPDLVVHDARLWAGLPDDVRRHYAFDVFAHFVETTISLRRSPVTAACAAAGGPLLLKWYADAASADSYGDIMRAAFEAGLCLASSSTCLPHRIQYVIGPSNDTGHVEGVFVLFRPWLESIRAATPARLHDAFEIITGRALSEREIDELCLTLHARSAVGVRRDRFRWTAATADLMAARVRGDLNADPGYVDAGSVGRLISAISHHD